MLFNPFVLASVSPPGDGVTHAMTELILHLAVILIGARVGGAVFQRFLRAPSVLGELVVGMIIGPYALGGVTIPGFGVLFPALEGTIPVSSELYGIATLASVLLLFLSGLETDLSTFMRYSLAGVAVGIGGLLFSFTLGAMCAVWFGVASGFTDPSALFLGTIATATSVGLTARILSEKKRMGSPEGVTILAAAVFDDVFGIVILAVVVGMAKVNQSGGSLHWGQIGFLAAKAIGFWVAFTVGGILLAKRITRILKLFRSNETIAAMCLGLALLLAGFSEMAGLAMIIGAYIMGLALSGTDIVNVLQDQLRGLYNHLTPVFFCVMGMMVDFRSMRGVLVLGAVYSLISILTKLIGCGLPALLMKFNMRGAFRIGAGMVPRAEVALIVAGVGLSVGAIGPEIFGVAIMMAMFSTLSAPLMLVKAFEGGSGIRGETVQKKEEMVSIDLTMPSADVAEFLAGRLVKAFRQEEFFVHRLHTDSPVYQIRKEDMAFTLMQHEEKLSVNAQAYYQHIARLIILEEVLALQDLLDSVKKMEDPGDMSQALLSGFFA